MRVKQIVLSIQVCVIVFLAAQVRSDEGMWPMDQLPVAQMKSRYGFLPDKQWIQHVTRSCVRFGTSGSASFVSADGLLMTNHHVGAEAIARLSTAGRDLMTLGYYAPTREDELPCAGLTLYVLMDMKEITQEVEAAVTAGMKPEDAAKARDETAARLAAEIAAQTGLFTETVDLYSGARRYVYSYKLYTDVRLVMAPELSVAYYGGDAANFEYPRYSFDVCFFRVYENGQPVKAEHHFTWADAGPVEGDFVLISGHPGQSLRRATVDHLTFLRDQVLPLRLGPLNQREVALTEFAGKSSNHARIAAYELSRIRNTRKALDARLTALLDGRIMLQRAIEEKALQAFLDDRDDIKCVAGTAWTDVRGAVQSAGWHYPAHCLIEERDLPFGRLHAFVRDLIRFGAARSKPEVERQPRYRRANWPTLQRQLAEPGLIDRDLEQLYLQDGLTALARVLGCDDPIVMAAFNKRSPEDRAAEIIAGTRLDQYEVRNKLAAAGAAAVEAGDDALVRFATRLEQAASDANSRYFSQMHRPLQDAYARLASASLEMHGPELPPDATGTLRLSIGTVAGYEQRGEKLPPMTRLKEMFDTAERRDSDAPWQLPASWDNRRTELDLETPLNFISTNDLAGGNSGSPVFNKERQIVGVVFDTNRPALAWHFQFDDSRGRSISVHAQAILHILRTVYGADTLADELQGK